VALVSRTDARHAGYVAALGEAGVEAVALTADVRDRDRLGAVLDTVAGRFGGVDAVYYGPGAADPSARPVPIDRVGSDAVREAMSWVYPAVDVVGLVLPRLIERGGGLVVIRRQWSEQVPKTSTVWVTSRKPCSAPIASAHFSTAGPSISTVRPQTRQTRWWWCSPVRHAR
jgi:NAD(P)-dependent dehydrogenase (short-subunit alcohol dehydrogenase family)